MDINWSNNRQNYSAVNGFAPPRKKTKGFGNFADSNRMAVGKLPTKKQIMKKRKETKRAVLTYKQKLGQGK